MLTPQKQKVFDFIKHYLQKHGYSPTNDEIAKGAGICSRGNAYRCVKALADEGYITLSQGRKRNIQINNAVGELRVLGRIAAGQPIEAIANDNTLNLHDKLLAEDHYVLQVKGDSMIGDNICDGDYIVCKKAQTARAGEIVVALIDSNEATLKRIQYNLDKTITLLPSNARLTPMVFVAERVAIQGIYVGLIRLN